MALQSENSSLHAEEPATQGGCLCSAVRFQFTGSPVHSSVCHCRSCQKASSAPAVAWLTVEMDAFRYLTGTPRHFHSSEGVLRSFCGVCGSPLTYHTSDEPDLIDIATVALDNPAAFAPTRESWLEHKLPWQPVNTALELTPRDKDSAGSPTP